MDTTLVLIVVSRPEAVGDRDAIRKTWGVEAVANGIRLVFTFAGESVNTTTRRRAMEEEGKRTRDLLALQIPDEINDDFLLVINSLNQLRQQFPGVRFFGKANADVWINVPKLIKRLDKLSADPEDFVLGHFIAGNSSEARENYQTSIDTDEEDPIQFAIGHLWIAPSKTIAKLIEAAKTTRGSIIIPDSIITGYLRKHKRIKGLHMEDFVDMWNTNPADCYTKQYSLIHGVFFNQKYEVHDQKC